MLHQNPQHQWFQTTRFVSYSFSIYFVSSLGISLVDPDQQNGHHMDPERQKIGQIVHWLLEFLPHDVIHHFSHFIG